MGKLLCRAGFWLLILAGSPAAWGNSFFNRAPQFNLPQGEIAFMGCYWSPLTIFGNGGSMAAPDLPNPNSTTNIYHSGNVGVGFDASKLGDLFAGADTPPPAAGEAVNEANQMVMEKGPGFGLTIAPVNYSTAYQNALLMHILSPAQWSYNPQLTRYCGMRPYILIGIIDYEGVFAGPAKVREKENDKPINYWGRRSVLEQDTDVFTNKKAVHSAALEFFLISTSDGSTLWEGNLLNSTGQGNNYQDLMRGLVENALKNLVKK